MIVAEHITHYAYSRGQGKKLLDDLSFTIHPGQVTVLLGPNGAGKSTLLKIMSGERKPSAGQVLWRGRSVHVIPPRELAVERAMLTQQYAVSLPFSVEEVVQMGRYPHTASGLTGKDRQIAAGCLRDMEAEHLSGRLFNTLSGGEQQRVQMARVLAQLEDGSAGRRKLLLLDEPTASMDWLHQQLALGKAREMAARGYTVVVVLHDLNLAAQYADQLILLRQGKLMAMGSPAGILDAALIEAVYGIRVTVLRPDSCDFPVVIPAAAPTHQKNTILHTH